MEQDWTNSSSLEQVLAKRWPAAHIEIHQTIDSTNKRGMRLAEEGRTPALIIAEAQTAGVGRSHRHFYSPATTGLYLSLVIDYPFYSDKMLLFTTHTAVALSQTITHFLPYERPEIKWVNDVYLRQKKIAGILVQAQSHPETNKGVALVIGVGINLYPPMSGFPVAIKDRAGAIFPPGEGPSRAEFATRFLTELAYWLDIDDPAIGQAALTYYRDHQFLMNKVVTFAKKNKEITGYVTGITDQYALVVRDQANQYHYLSSGEVHMTHYRS